MSSVNYLIEPKDNLGQGPLIVHVSRIKPFYERIDEDTTNDERDRKNLVILNLEEEAKTIFYRLDLEQETYLNIKQKLSTIYISKKKTTLEELFTHQLEKPEKNNDYYHFKVLGALENSLQNKQIFEALTAGVTYDLKKIIYTRNPQTLEEWLDYANTIRPVTSARGQPKPQRGLDRWRPESTPSPGQGHYRPQYGQLAFRRPGSGRFAFRNYADNTLPKEPRETATSSGHQPRSQGCDPSSRKGPA
ncbi:hypothetical protein LAZ67_9000198 [Cordylochernes scorpioides]|uniref:Uncharacterized protein n=1 Tax=Cordylochernes scorpioides TaxID=51811 RepID=A0ABY6KSV9_9ARAC|nr:hypothetical protein LAZ67_9000198 [Cordylochernes scorpioides]